MYKRLTTLAAASMLAGLALLGPSAAMAAPTAASSGSSSERLSGAVERESVPAEDPEGVIRPASAAGTAIIPAFTYSYGGITIRVPAGCLFTHVINGEGRHVNWEDAGTDCAGPGYFNGGFCNWRIDFIFYDTAGKHYLTHKGQTHNRCDHNTFRVDDVKNWNPRYGKACATFSVNGTERARQCHSITS